MSKNPSYISSAASKTIVSRTELRSALSAISACKAHAKKGKNPRMLGDVGAFADYPSAIAATLEVSASQLIAVYVGLLNADHAYDWAQRESVTVDGCTISLKKALAAYLGESVGLSAGALRKAVAANVKGE
jgi:ubiquinone biosynthesis protein UbiJ